MSESQELKSKKLASMEDEMLVWTSLSKLLRLFVACNDDDILPLLMEVRNRQAKIVTNFFEQSG